MMHTVLWNFIQEITCTVLWNFIQEITDMVVCKFIEEIMIVLAEVVPFEDT